MPEIVCRAKVLRDSLRKRLHMHFFIGGVLCVQEKLLLAYL